VAWLQPHCWIHRWGFRLLWIWWDGFSMGCAYKFRPPARPHFSVQNI